MASSEKEESQLQVDGADFVTSTHKGQKHYLRRLMNCILWNIRGINKEQSLSYLVDLVNEYKPEIVGVVEPLIAPPIFCPAALSRLGFSSNFIHNNIPSKRGNIWVFLKEGINATIVDISCQQISIKIEKFTISMVHASSYYVQRRVLWDELSHFGLSVEAWMIIRDFNIVTRNAERKGGRLPCQIAVLDFNDFINSNCLVDSTTLGHRYSWSNRRCGNKRMIQKIDRALVNHHWLNAASNWKSKIAKRKFSDHSPIIGWNARIPKPGNIPFRFKNVWLQHLDIKKVVETSWKQPLLDVPIRTVTKKLKRLKADLKKWSWETYGSMSRNLKQMDEERG
ncbi:hypothetical protein IFM89_025316 [Coptis chinensis]|uniref:Endonuclease/exonuclease/phosphatase domain-containing protein n=1 Tax=Coptis chinensis TaxID=261450 RepID=A0A835HPF4_9MAGN|nr:hypothetical protein IFM89_025316 [Coptis chinensis]